MKDKVNSPTLDKMLQGGKFKAAHNLQYQIVKQELGLNFQKVIKYSTHEESLQSEWYVNLHQTRGCTLVIETGIACKGATISFDVTCDLELTEE